MINMHPDLCVTDISIATITMYMDLTIIFVVV